MNQFLVFNLVSLLIGVFGTYFLVRIAVKHGIKDVLKSNEHENVIDQTTETQKQVKNNQIVVFGVLVLVVLFLFTFL